MIKNNYIVSRDSVYIGTVIKTEIINLRRDFHSNRLRVFRACKLRNIIFTPNTFGYARDLLYSSPSYPILNSINDRDLEKKDEIILIDEVYNLGELLNYLGYGYYLSYEDILKIRKTLFNGKFTKLNSNLFGWQEINFDKLEFYRNGKKITDPKEIERKKWQLLTNKSKKDFFRTFIRYNEKLKEFEDIINSKSDHSLIDFVLKKETKMNTFTPHPQEGKIKKIH